MKRKSLIIEPRRKYLVIALAVEFYVKLVVRAIVEAGRACDVELTAEELNSKCKSDTVIIRVGLVIITL